LNNSATFDIVSSFNQYTTQTKCHRLIFKGGCGSGGSLEPELQRAAHNRSVGARFVQRLDFALLCCQRGLFPIYLGLNRG
jgi:hypothetical protein